MERFVITTCEPAGSFLLDVTTLLTGYFILLYGLACMMQVYRLRLLGDHHHPTRIAFVEFVMVLLYPLYF